MLFMIQTDCTLMEHTHTHTLGRLCNGSHIHK